MPFTPAAPIAPQHGALFRIRLVRKGPYVAARVDLEDGLWWITQAGERLTQPYREDQLEEVINGAVMEGKAFSHPLVRLLVFGQPIDEQEYDFLIAEAKWAKQHAPEHPAANPDKPISLRAAPSVF